MKCLVSGATGFIGRSLCRRLALEGHAVTALSKSGGSLPGGIPTVALDLALDLPPLEQLQGVEVVFHLAGIAHQHAPASAYVAVNERATVALAERCQQAGVGRFVFLSSVKAMGPARDNQPRTEGDCLPPVDPYGQSKWRAECQLREACENGPMPVVIVRPALVYGARPKGNLALLARGVRAGLPRPPAGGARSMIALDDLVAALLLVASLPLQGVHTWIAADPEPYSTRFLYDRLRTAAGRGTGLAWLPAPLWRLAAALLDLRAGRRGGSTYDKLFGTELYSAAALMQATGWRPAVRFEQLAPQLLRAGSAGEVGG